MLEQGPMFRVAWKAGTDKYPEHPGRVINLLRRAWNKIDPTLHQRGPTGQHSQTENM